MKRSNPEVSVVICVYNEEEVIPTFIEVIRPILCAHTQSYELVFVNDGSNDQTLALLLAEVNQNSDVKVVNLSRNFGKDIGLSAGLDHAQGEAVIPIDVDLQDPPELIIDMLRYWRQGVASVVALRSDRSEDDPLKQKSAKLFYWLFARLSNIRIEPNAGDFRLLDRRVVDVINRMPEKTRFMKGMFAYPGFTTKYLPFKRQPRAAGKTKWNFWRLWNFALDGIFSFTNAPLQIWTYLGFTLALLSFLYTCWIVAKTIAFGIDVPGYASLIAIMLFTNGVMLIGIGILGEYIGRIFNEVKNRPLYVLEGVYGNNLDVELDQAN